MTLVELRKPETSGAVSGGAMDRVIVKRTIDRKILVAAGAGAVLFLVLLFWVLAPTANSQSVSAERLSIAPARNGLFEDFLPLRARVTPLVTIYLDAVEAAASSSWRSRMARPSPKGNFSPSCRTPISSCRRLPARPRSSSSLTTCVARSSRFSRPGPPTCGT